MGRPKKVKTVLEGLAAINAPGSAPAKETYAKMTAQEKEEVDRFVMRWEEGMRRLDVEPDKGEWIRVWIEAVEMVAKGERVEDWKVGEEDYVRTSYGVYGSPRKDLG